MLGDGDTDLGIGEGERVGAAVFISAIVFSYFNTPYIEP